MQMRYVFRNRILRLRQQRGLSRDQLSRAVGLAPMAVWRHEVHLVSVSDPLKAAYAQALGVPVARLFDFGVLVSVSDTAERTADGGGDDDGVTRPGDRRRRRHRPDGDRAGIGAVSTRRASA